MELVSSGEKSFRIPRFQIFICGNVNRCHQGNFYNSITHIPDKPCLLFPKYQTFTGNICCSSTKYPHTVCWGQSKQEWKTKSLFKLFDMNGEIFWLIKLPMYHTVCKYDPFLKSRKAARLKKILAACIYVCRGLQLPSNSVCGGFDKHIVMRGKNWSLLTCYNTLFTFFIWLTPSNWVTGAWTEHHAV